MSGKESLGAKSSSGITGTREQVKELLRLRRLCEIAFRVAATGDKDAKRLHRALIEDYYTAEEKLSDSTYEQYSGIMQSGHLRAGSKKAADIFRLAFKVRSDLRAKHHPASVRAQLNEGVIKNVLDSAFTRVAGNTENNLRALMLP